MAGSYNHCVNEEGKLLNNENLNGMLENGGDVYEAVEEMYGMIWWLADKLSNADKERSALYWVDAARMQYQDGLDLSPGVEDE